MKKKRESMTKYITLGQGWQYGFPEQFEKISGLKVKRLGYTDSSTTTYTFMVRTKKTIRDVENFCWQDLGIGWVHVTQTDPREVRNRYAFG